MASWYGGDDFNGAESQEHGRIKNESESADNSQQEGNVGEYVRTLLKEKMTLDPVRSPNAMRLIDQEVTQAQSQGGKAAPRDNRYINMSAKKPIKVAVKVLVPVKEFPSFNFVGKILGPKGNSLKRLQEDTMTRMSVLGKGSVRDKSKEEEMRRSLDPKYAHLCDELHVEISALAPPAEAYNRIAYALTEIRKYLIPDNNDDIRQEQLHELQVEQLHHGAPGGGGRGRGPPLLRRPPAGMPHPPHPPPRAHPPPRGLLNAPRPGLPLPPPPRVQQSKTKVLSILERARVAMMESYGGYEDPAEMEQDYYEPASGGYDHEPGYTRGGHNGAAGDHYGPSSYADEAPGRWKGHKEPGGMRMGAGAPRFGRPRGSPYGRPLK